MRPSRTSWWTNGPSSEPGTSVVPAGSGSSTTSRPSYPPSLTSTHTRVRWPISRFRTGEVLAALIGVPR